MEAVIDQIQTQAGPNGATLDVERVAWEVLRRLRDVSENGRALEPEPLVGDGIREIVAPIGISVRHVHLCPEHVQILFGRGHDLSVYHDLYQRGYYAAQEQVMVVGRRRCIEKVRVLGPPRALSQVELSQTDALILGLRLPIAISGSDPAVQPITLVGPEGTVMLSGKGKGGVFIMQRHVHMSDTTAERLGVGSGDLIDLRIDGPRPTTLHGVMVRVKAGWRTEVHLDTDEANACGIRSGQSGRLILPHHQPTRREYGAV